MISSSFLSHPSSSRHPPSSFMFSSLHGISHVGGVQVCRHRVVGFQDDLFPPPSYSTDGMNAVQSAAPPPLPTPATFEDSEEGGAVVAVHPAV